MARRAHGRELSGNAPGNAVARRYEAAMRSFAVTFVLCSIANLPAQTPGLRWLDLDGDDTRQVTVRREPGQYLGHPTTVLLEDGETMLCVFPRGHGKGAIVLVRSEDGGRSWSEPLPVPASWATSLETPTIHRLIDPRDGARRLVLFSGLYPLRSSVSNDDGRTWTELLPIGEFGGIVAMASVTRLTNGDYAAFFHDDGRYFTAGGKRSQFTVYRTLSADGGLTWRTPDVVWTGDTLDLCEPGVVRAPDGKRLCMLLRENKRVAPSHVLFSDDETASWSAPKELPASLTGDRHVGGYAPDGRLLVSFRDMAPGSPTRGDWVAWVGTFDDLVAGREGQYRVRLLRNWLGSDCAYPGVEVLPDGTFVLTTYGHWIGGEQPFVRSVRLRLDELDARAKGPLPAFERPPSTVVPVAKTSAAWQQRVAADLAAARQGGHRVLFLGDSITQSWNAEGKQVFAEHFAPRGVFNAGVSGDRTQHVLWRLDHGLLQALAANGNDIRGVVLMIGTNNSNGNDNTAEEIAAGVQAIVARLRRGLPQAQVLLLAIFPRGQRPDAQRVKNATASTLAAAPFLGDAMVHCRDLGALFTAPDGTIEKQVMRDYLHLTAAGYGIWAQALLADVDHMLGESR